VEWVFVARDTEIRAADWAGATVEAEAFEGFRTDGVAVFVYRDARDRPWLKDECAFAICAEACGAGMDLLTSSKLVSLSIF
jgi:hypothetical protein